MADQLPQLPLPRVRNHSTSCAVFDPSPGPCDCGSPPKVYDADEMQRYGEQCRRATNGVPSGCIASDEGSNSTQKGGANAS